MRLCSLGNRFYRNYIPHLSNFAPFGETVFMTTKRRTEIIVETERIIAVPVSAARVHRWCNACLQQVEVVTPEQAALLVHVTPRTVYRWIEAQLLHFVEEADGCLLICRPSLLGQHRESR
jgi:hypothetical protein